MKAGQWKEPVADLFACSPADIRIRHGPVLEPLTTGDDECRGTSRRYTRIAQDANGAESCKLLSPQPPVTTPLKGILKSGRLANTVAYSLGIQVQAAHNELMHVLKLNHESMLRTRLRMAELEGKLEGLDGPARSSAARELRAFYSALVCTAASKITTESLPATCIMHGRIDKTARKFHLRTQCVCALHHVHDAGM